MPALSRSCVAPGRVQHSPSPTPLLGSLGGLLSISSLGYPLATAGFPVGYERLVHGGETGSRQEKKNQDAKPRANATGPAAAVESSLPSPPPVPSGSGAAPPPPPARL